MATLSNTTRLSGTLSIGGRLLAGVIGGAAAGSLILGGWNVITDSSQNSSPSLVYDSGSYITFQQVRLTSSGNWLAGKIQNPHSSGAVIHALSLQCGALAEPSATTHAYVSTAEDAESGSALRVYWNQIAADTGALVLRTNTGTLSARFPLNHYVQFVVGTGTVTTVPAAAGDCFGKLWT